MPESNVHRVERCNTRRHNPAPGSRGLVIPIDPTRATGWVLVELVYCLGRDLRSAAGGGRGSWRRADRSRWFRIIRWVVVAGGVGLGGAAADQHLRLVRLLLSLSG